MDVGTTTADRIVNVGNAADLYALYSTAVSILGSHARKVYLGLSFLECGCCNYRDCAKTARQLLKIRDELAMHAPSDAVWDIEHPAIPAPWSGDLAPDITSCADLFTTSEGELLLPELIALLRYAESVKQDVIVLG